MIEVWCFTCKGIGYIPISPIGFINIVCPTCIGQGTLNKGEIQMSEEEVVRATVTFDGPLNDLQQKINEYEATIKEQAERLDKRLGDISKLQVAVHNFFKDQFDGGDEEITVHRDEANELLGEIGADLLQQEFEGHVTITYSFTVKAESVEDAEEKVKNAVGSLEYSIDADADDEYSEESIEVEF
jgi:hypothetical protein